MYVGLNPHFHLCQLSRHASLHEEDVPKSCSGRVRRSGMEETTFMMVVSTLDRKVG